MNDLSLITKEEWVILEDLNLDIYDTPITQILPRTLEKCRALIDYSHSLTYLIRYENGQQTSFQYESPDIPQQYLRLYVEKFIMTDRIISTGIPAVQRPPFSVSRISCLILSASTPNSWPTG